MSDQDIVAPKPTEDKDVTVQRRSKQAAATSARSMRTGSALAGVLVLSVSLSGCAGWGGGGAAAVRTRSTS